MDDSRAAKKLYKGASDGARPHGRWKDLRMIGASNRNAFGRSEWKKAFERAKGTCRADINNKLLIINICREELFFTNIV